MIKKYNVEVDCANCAAKMEDACSKLSGIKAISIYFMAQKMTVDFEDGQDINAVLDQIEKTCKKVERSFELYR
jgi:cation transport ATPase